MGHYQLLERSRGDVLVQARVFGIGTDQTERLNDAQNERSSVAAAALMQAMKTRASQPKGSQDHLLNGAGRCPVGSKHAFATIASDGEMQCFVLSMAANNKAQR